MKFAEMGKNHGIEVSVKCIYCFNFFLNTVVLI